MAAPDQRTAARSLLRRHNLLSGTDGMTDLILPGLNGSGPDHWQRWWLTSGRDARLVAQDNWENPQLKQWRPRLASEVQKTPDAILVAHSLACALVAQLAAWRSDLPVGAALLVAPADVDDAGWTSVPVAGFGPMPLKRLPFPAVVVASRNDPYVAFERAKFFAARWGADFVDLGEAGHINAETGFGPWPEGLRLAERLSESVRELRKAG
jgi:predicted alpha/beta hydrolase family esterase